MSDWLLNGRPFTQEDVGDLVSFVYLITDKETEKMYVGKKGFWTSKVRMVKKKKKRYLAPSDWESYHGSNKELVSLVEEKGPDRFVREILHLCRIKGAANYLEAM